MKASANKILEYILVPVLIFISFTLIYHLGIFNKLIFPDPLRIIAEFIRLFSNVEILDDFAFTFLRVITALAISTLIGIPIGLILGYFERAYKMLEFAIDFFRSIPAVALFPLFLLFFGIGDISKILLSVWATTFIIIVNSSYGVKHATKVHIKMAKVYSTSSRYLFKDIIFPGAMPHIFSGVRIGASISLILVVVTEMFMGSVNGLGHAIIDAQLKYEIPEMYAIIILTGIFGYLLNKVLLVIEKRKIHWIR